MALGRYFGCCLVVLSNYHILQVWGTNHSTAISNETIHILQSSSILLECEVLSGNGKSKWKHGEDIIFIDKNALSTHMKSTVTLIQNYSLFISPTLLFHEGVYECIRNSVTVRRYQLIVEVPPRIYISINGTNSTEFAVLDQRKSFVALCYANSSKPQVKLSWKITNKVIRPSEYSQECRITEQVIYDNVYNCMSKLETRIQDDKGTITCIASADSIFGERNTSVSFQAYSSQKWSTAYLWPISCIILIPLIISARRFYIVLKMKGHPQRYQPSKMEQESLHHGDSEDTVALEMIPPDVKSRSCPALNENLQDIYASTRRQSSTIDIENITFTDEVPGDGIFGCWLATTTDDSVIVAKCLKGNPNIDDVNMFHDIACALSCLPIHRNLANIIAVSKANVSSHIFQEFVECGTLRDFLIALASRYPFQQHPEDGGKLSAFSDKLKELSRFAFDVAEGMAFLYVHNFCHPALSAKKILLNSRGICKLIDFWPAESSELRLTYLYHKKNPPIAWLAPETIFLRQYSHESDVWSYAVVLWEVFSLGDIPYQGMTEEEIENEIRNSRFLRKPPKCPESMFNLMLASWNLSCKDRPTFHKLRNDLTSLGCNADELQDQRDFHPHYFTLSR